MSGSILLDFKKAFDLIDHDKLLEKLTFYKCSELTVSCFRSYLCDHGQMVTILGSNSSFKTIARGVPQGSILGPILFLVFINDLRLYMNHCNSYLFADDTTLHTLGKTIPEIQHKLQMDLNSVTDWCTTNCMVLNPKKTTCMKIITQKKITHSPKLNLFTGSKMLANTHCQKLLGVFLNETLSFNNHIYYLCSNLSSKITLLKHLSRYVPQQIIKLFFTSYIQPLIDYGCTVSVEQ